MNLCLAMLCCFGNTLWDNLEPEFCSCQPPDVCVLGRNSQAEGGGGEGAISKKCAVSHSCVQVGSELEEILGHNRVVSRFSRVVGLALCNLLCNYLSRFARRWKERAEEELRKKEAVDVSWSGVSRAALSRPRRSKR